jgi:hypothetical protein
MDRVKVKQVFGILNKFGEGLDLYFRVNYYFRS